MRKKILATIISLCICITALVFGVTAATQVSFSISSSVSFVVTNIFFTLELDITGAYDENGNLMDIPSFTYDAHNTVATSDMLNESATAWMTTNSALLNNIHFNPNTNTPLSLTVNVTNYTPNKGILVSIGEEQTFPAESMGDESNITATGTPGVCNPLTGANTIADTQATASWVYELKQMTIPLNVDFDWLICLEEVALSTFQDNDIQASYNWTEETGYSNVNVSSIPANGEVSWPSLHIDENTNKYYMNTSYDDAEVTYPTVTPSPSPSPRSMSYSARAYSGETTVDKIILPDSCTDAQIEKDTAYELGKGVSNISLGSQVTQIEVANASNYLAASDSALYGAGRRRLIRYLGNNTSFTIDSRTTSVDAGAFRNCTTLEEIILTTKVASIGSEVFEGCKNLQRLTLPFVGAENYTSQLPMDQYLNATIFHYFKQYTLTEIDQMGDVDMQIIELPYPFNEDQSICSLFSTNLNSITILPGAKMISNYALYDTYNITNIVIPDSITSIGISALGCDSEVRNASIRLPNNLSNLGEIALQNNTTITNTSVLQNLTSFGYSSFQLSGISNVPISDSIEYIGNSSFYDCASLATTTYEGIKYLGNTLKPYLVALEVIDKTKQTYVLHDQTRILGYSLFAECTNLSSINLPANLIQIGTYAFHTCSSLTSINLPENLKYIEEGAFLDCSSLASINIPNSVMDIGFRAFFGCNLTYTTHNSVNYIGNPNNPYLAVVSVSDKTLVTYSIESSTKFILDSAFEACINLNSIILPSGLKTIGSNAFWGCSSLTSINIPKSVIAIEAAAFLGCSDLTEIRLPDSSIRVLNNAFGDATIYCKNPKNIWKWSFGQNYNNIIWED